MFDSFYHLPLFWLAILMIIFFETISLGGLILFRRYSTAGLLWAGTAFRRIRTR